MDTQEQVTQAAIETAQQSVTPGLTAFFSAYSIEILIAGAAILAGYSVSQWIKNLPSRDPSPTILAMINGLVSFAFMAWWLPDAYDVMTKLKIGSAVGITSPISVMVLFTLIDKFLPGQAQAIKQGIYYPGDEEEKTVFQHATRMVATALVGKRKDKRKGHRLEDNPETEIDETLVWTAEQRAEITGKRR